MSKNRTDDWTMRKPRTELRTIGRLHAFLLSRAAPPWLGKEHYLLCGMCRSVLSELENADPIPYVKNTKQQPVPYAFTVSETVVPDADTEQTVKSLAHFHPDEAFLRMYPTMRAAAVLCRIAQHRNDADAPQAFGVWIDQLRRTREIDWSAVHSRLSDVEKALMQDPGGAYPLCDRDTKAAYRNAVRSYARRRRVTEAAAAQAILQAAAQETDAEKRQISYHLFPSPKPYGGIFWYLWFYLTALALSGVTAACLWHLGALYALVIGCTLYLPYYVLVRTCTDMTAARLLIGRQIPILRYDIRRGEIPAEGRVLNVITMLLHGGDQDTACVRNLERFYLRCRGKNVSFGLLCDLVPGKEACKTEDEEHIARLREQIAALNQIYGNVFCLFVRRRVYSTGEQCYMGWERKRGAVLMLARLLRGVGREEFLCVEAPGDSIENIRYVCTLDEDTVLPPEALSDMVGAMLHPHNRPVIVAGAVRRGCAILQPDMRTTLAGASASRFTLLCCGRGGMDPYSRHHTDAESLMFGEGSFCGKGLFDVDAYLAVLDGAFPDHAVLSHDFLEGARLGCRNMPSVTFSDTQPTTPGAFFARQSRWVRGDVQALRFAFSHHRNAFGETVKNPISAVAGLRIVDHVLHALLPADILRAAIVFAFLPLPRGYAAWLLLLLFLPYLVRPLRLCLRPGAWRAMFRVFYSAVYTDLRQAIMFFGFRLVFAAEEGWINTRAIITALYRMLISKRRLLAWKTAGECEAGLGAGSIAAAFRAMWGSVLISLVLILFSPHPSVKLLGGIWMLAPFAAAYLSHRPQVRRMRRFSSDPSNVRPDGALTLSELTAYAEPIWRFFAEHVNAGTRHLPPDNVQWFPVSEKKIANRTSPTNIGLYLCACISACDFHLIDAQELFRRLDAACASMLTLRRYRGHFYNWYDLAGGDVIGVPYISTVDSGNLACALLCASAGAAAYAREDVRLWRTAKKLRRMAEEMDFSFLYDARAEQLHLGYRTDTETCARGRYDLYCSEVRSAVYFAAAMGQIPARAWEVLGRPIFVKKRIPGVYSWTGSTFEYFMPALWLPHPLGAWSSQMLAAAFEMQISDTDAPDGIRIFGKSEGAYYALDAERNFQYQPHGTQALALESGVGTQQLCMPYALYLMLPFAPGEVRRVLDTLPSLGMAGPHGLYEALDCTHDRVGGGYAVVRSYMAHHQGMSLLSLANAAFDSIWVKRFLTDKRMEAYTILLEERIPTDAQPVHAAACNTCYADTDSASARDGLGSYRMSEKAQGKTGDADRSQYAVLSNAASYITASGDGRMMLCHGTLAVTPPAWDPHAVAPLFFCLDPIKRIIYTPCAYGGQEQETTRYTFREGTDALYWEAYAADGTVCTLCARVSTAGTGFSFDISLSRHGAPIGFVLTFLFRPVLFAPYAYAVHRTFAELFLHMRFDGRNTVLVERRPRSADEEPLSLRVSAGGLDRVSAVTDGAAVLPLGYTVADCRDTAMGIPPHRHPGTGRDSAVVPLIYMRGRAVSHHAVIGLQLGDREVRYDRELFLRVRSEMQMLCGGGSGVRYVSAMLGAIANRTTRLIRSESRCRPVNAPRGKERLWKYGISGDLPYFCVPADERESTFAAAADVLSSWKYLMLCGIHTDLVFCVEESDAYGQPNMHRLQAEIERQGLRFFLGTGASVGGLHLCRTQDMQEDGVLLTAAMVFAEDGREAAHPPQPPQILRLPPDEKPTRYELDERRIIVNKGKQKMPWSFLLTNGVMGTLLTGDGLGFTFFENARECRVTPWFGDALSDRCGEYLLLRFSGERGYYDLCRCAQSMVITPEEVHYLGLLSGLSYRISVSIPDRMRHKRIVLRLKNESAAPLEIRVRYQLQPMLGVIPEDGDAVSWRTMEHGLQFRAETNAACAMYTAEVSLAGCERFTAGQAGQTMLYVGGAMSVPAGEEIVLPLHLRVTRDGERSVTADALVPRRMWARPKIRSGDTGLDALAATWLPWQIVSVRLFGRCGYYQPGGAYGFRDQLQDAMAAAEFAPDLLYAQLFRAAAHQYREGDVQHWWHPGPLTDRAKSHRGIRSRCSDDLLWLPLAAARYASLSGDYSFLDKSVRYIESPPLEDGVQERYEIPLRSEVRESLYMHCVRAIELVIRRGFGVHGMPYIGNGDWNDGMNRVGAGGLGESVFCGMFLLLVLSEFLPLCEKMGDHDGAAAYGALMRQLATAIEGEAWNGHWYRRAWYDDGTPMGEPGDAEAEIDLLPQAFAAIVHARVRLPGGGHPLDAERVHAAMLAAYERLFDREHGVFALLSPPFGAASGEHPDPGYIAGYPAGVRENGGQYTHAAVWGAMGLFAVGETELGMEVVRALSPLWHTADDAGIARYQKEPWALCGDVLTTPGRVGEGGWSLYTGSAGWYYRLLIALFGDGGK